MHETDSAGPSEEAVEPSPTAVDGQDGRDADGRFVTGNQFSRGNPFSRRVNEIRSALMEAVTPEDVQAVVKALLAKAKKGDAAAAREVLDRCLGKAKVLDLDDDGPPVNPLANMTQSQRDLAYEFSVFLLDRMEAKRRANLPGPGPPNP